jgi:dipeptidyl aminopeptidase/acylaminoacyl peptidase
MAEVSRLAEKFDLRSVLPGMKCPYLIIHGGHDVLGVEAAGQLYEAAKAAGIDVSLRIVSEEETGADHCQHDNPTLGQELMLDWLTDQLGSHQRNVTV